MPEETVVTVVCGQTARDYSLPLQEPIASWLSVLAADLLPQEGQAALVFCGEALDPAKTLAFYGAWDGSVLTLLPGREGML